MSDMMFRHRAGKPTDNVKNRKDNQWVHVSSDYLHILSKLAKEAIDQSYSAVLFAVFGAIGGLAEFAMDSNLGPMQLDTLLHFGSACIVSTAYNFRDQCCQE